MKGSDEFQWGVGKENETNDFVDGQGFTPTAKVGDRMRRDGGWDVATKKVLGLGCTRRERHGLVDSGGYF